MSQVYPHNVCGGAAGVPQTYVWNPGDPPLNIRYPTQGAAGCAPTLVYSVPLP